MRIYILPAGEPVPGLYRTRELIYTYTYTIQSVKYKIHTLRERPVGGHGGGAAMARSPNILVFREREHREAAYFIFKVLPPCTLTSTVPERLSIRSIAQGAALEALLGCDCKA